MNWFKEVKARKDHWCACCHTKIEKGETYVYHSWVDDTFGHQKFHLHCKQWYDALWDVLHKDNIHELEGSVDLMEVIKYYGWWESNEKQK